ncbi:auxilin-like protein 1 isoform X2 [Andrographis paniculata]|uniref:auxilin-like protein 1 isoform X2 n=1 Tax=Andrographis paniculata TaxID=175694 RepID=UPI0021E717C7|nr:auxilin-like protein 1 isoform X2 [Andrographis paniculata]
MESMNNSNNNIPHCGHSLAANKQRSFFSDSSSSDVVFTSHKSVYDDAFMAAPPKLDLGRSTLAPRLQDYSEIFGALHTPSSSSSIPLLHLDGDSFSDAFTNYTEVFGGIKGFPFTHSFEDFFGQFGGEYDSSDEQWSPAESDSVSDELDPRGGSDNTCRLSDGEAHCLQEGDVSWRVEDKHCPMHVVEHLEETEEFGERVDETKNIKYILLNTFHGGFDPQVNDFNSLENQGHPAWDKPFVTVSDISLRTKPSQLPPPLRPPPALVKLKDSIGKVESDSSSSLFAIKQDDGEFSEDVKAKHQSEEDSISRGDMCSIKSVCMSSDEDELFCLQGKVATGSAPIIEDGIGSTNSKEQTLKSCELPSFNHIIDRSVGNAAQRKATENIGVIETKINRQAFDMVGDCNTLMQHVTQDNCRHQISPDHAEFNQKDNNKRPLELEEASERKPTVRYQQTRWDEENGLPEMTGEYCISNCKQQKENQYTRSNSRLFGKLSGNLSETEEYGQQLGESEILRINTLRVERQKRSEDVEGEETSERVKRIPVTEEIEKQCTEVSENDYDRKLETAEIKESKILIEEDKDDGESFNNSYRILSNEQSLRGVEEGNKLQMEACKTKVNEIPTEVVEQAENDKEHKLVHTSEVFKRRRDGPENIYNERYTDIEKKAGNEETFFESEGTWNISTDACVQAKLIGTIEENEPVESNEYERVLKIDLSDQPFNDVDQLNILSGGCKLPKVIEEGMFSVKHDSIQIMGLNQTESSEGCKELRTGSSCNIYDAEAVVDDTLGTDINRYDSHDGNTCILSSSVMDLHNSPEKMTDSSLNESRGFSCVVPDNRCSELKYGLKAESITSTKDERSGNTKGTQIVNKKEDTEDTFTRCQEIRNSLIYRSNVEDAPFIFGPSENPLYSIKSAKSQRIEMKDKNIKDNLANQKYRETMTRESDSKNDHMRKVEEEREREREREKDRMTVDKTALQAHERSYPEARKRTERAAIDRTAAEVRFRAADTYERLEKSSIVVRLRTERATHERATAEARLQAVKKYSAQDRGSETHDHAEKYGADRFSASLRSGYTRQSSLTSDFRFRSTSNMNVLQHSYSSAHFGTEGESPERCKARLERYKRTEERAANALAEKNRRDLLAQKEREERNRVAEVLDAEVKRWSIGKEGNLRALLSTLQYILGPDSGWQPVPLTEVITSAAVKKSYRKATLCVHPDKLQQRGATIQQKYISEKVFDLLKKSRCGRAASSARTSAL